MTTIERFYLHVLKTETCWLWTGAKDRDGYGRFWWNGRTGRAGVFIFEWTYGPLSSGKVPCHNCDTPSCIRPGHLFAGTQSENIRDAVRKGRWPQGHHTKKARGEQNGNNILTEEQVRKIRYRYRRGQAPSPSPVSLRGLAAEYGVSKYAIWSILKGFTWRHLGDSDTV